MRTAFLLILLHLAIAGPAQAQSNELRQFERTVDAIRSYWGNPGTVMTIVRDGQVLLQKGYGETRLAGGQPVTPTTLTSVASVTKPFTSVSLAMLVAEGAFAWDDPVKKLIPEFRFADDYRTESTTIRDLITHGAGLPNLLSAFYSADYTIQELLNELPAAEPTTGFRERMEYSQVGIALLGEVIHRASGRSWPDFVRARIFEPLGMESSYAGTQAFLEAYPEPDAVPNLMGRVRRSDGQYVASPWRGLSQIYSAAGGIVTTGEDMVPFMQLLVSGGVINGRRLLPAELLEETQTANEIDHSMYVPVIHANGGLVAYGLGWFLYDYEGIRIVEHPGSNLGTSVMALVPDSDIGVFVSSAAQFTLDSDRMVSALKFAALSYALGLPQQDWVALLAE